MEKAFVAGYRVVVTCGEYVARHGQILDRTSRGVDYAFPELASDHEVVRLDGERGARSFPRADLAAESRVLGSGQVAGGAARKLNAEELRANHLLVRVSETLRRIASRIEDGRIGEAETGRILREVADRLSGH